MLKAPAKVLACLRPGYLRVIVWYGVGILDGGIPFDVPLELVPFDLRMPNSDFTVVVDGSDGGCIAVERK
jgi:hypothetical protein